MKALQAMYEDRVIAFDHQSISRDPTENIAWLLDTIPDGLTLDFDIVCHSRGGLVARSLTERTEAMPGSRKIRVHRTALVGTVNNGTILADVKHWNDLVDTLSTVLKPWASPSATPSISCFRSSVRSQSPPTRTCAGSPAWSRAASS